MNWEPVEEVKEDQPGYLIGFDGPGWYFKDPSQVHNIFSSEGIRIAGPYPDKETALAEYRAYCEAMTI